MFTFVLPEYVQDIALLVVRLMVAIALAHESWLKMKDMKAFAKNDGVPVPVGWFVAIAEMAAAVSFATGFLSQWAAIGLILLMIATTFMHVVKWHSKYWAQKGGWEYDIIMIAFALVILAFGAGNWALSWPWV
ncbi:MAG: DoxX family protein [Homoserinimonas sp.]|nr:DoxX family protein [Homoserinimonas sp.]